MAHRHHFIGSLFVGPSQGAITLRGEIDAYAADQLAEHLDGFLDTATRFITVDATEVSSCDPRVLELLNGTEHRLAKVGGLLIVTGLHPSLLAAAGAPSPTLAEVPQHRLTDRA